MQSTAPVEGDPTVFWTDETSVLFTSYWGWSPETWGALGWTGNRGRGRRDRLLRELTDPFIAVCYVTCNQGHTDPEFKGKIAGFYLVSHETGDRDEFTDPVEHQHSPEKWRHSLRAIRAFTYLPEHRMSVPDLDPALLARARSVAAMGEVLKDPSQIARLRNTPWIEVPVYSPGGEAVVHSADFPLRGRTRAGPASENGYFVSAGTLNLKRQLYILHLSGDTDAYLGRPAAGRSIFKVGLSVSPEMRRQTFQKSMPRGAYEWKIHHPDKRANASTCPSFDAAIAGEDAMKRHLVRTSEWLGGEFYLASEDEIDKAWELGRNAVRSFGKT